ncbi:E3 ubiquitin-protein ligase bre1 [Rhizophlyctis rosea]|uniref:E3 ubiquitin protein ligase n=1 Tax=Rhizophlyctis rosea TaxID=64517 RepID=A0AAD5SCF0_9FUNG|nr:E3 ubiquitin-protein ligase bre1 [Rhizophlyctis rosea]
MPEVALKEERKRSREDETHILDSSTKHPHPFKRLNTGDRRNSSLVKVEEPAERNSDDMEVDEDDATPEEVIKFQKIAIWMQLQDYKKRSQLAENQLETLKEEKRCYEKTLGTVYRQWAQSVGRGAGDGGSSGKGKRGVTDVESLQGRCDELSSEVIKLRSKLERKKKKVSDLSTQLESTTDKLLLTERKVERAKMGVLGSAGPAKELPGVKDERTQEQKDKEVPEDTTSLSVLAQRRLEEVQEMKTEKIKLVQELDQLKLQLANGEAEGREGQRYSYADLEREYEYAKTLNVGIREDNDKLKQEVEVLKKERQQFKDQMEEEEKARRKEVDDKIRSMTDDMARLRGRRESLQQQLDLRKSKDDQELLMITETRDIANNRKDRIISLEATLQRIRAGIAAGMGDRVLWEFFMDNRDNADRNPLEEVRRQAREAEERARDLEERLRAYQLVDEGVEDVKQLAYEKEKLKGELDDLRDQLAKYEDLFGSESDSSEFARRLKERDEEVQKLRLEVEHLRKSQRCLEDEIANVEMNWTQVEEQNSRKVLELAAREEFTVMIAAERKHKETQIENLRRQCTTLANQLGAIKKQSDLQLEMIRKLEERERNLGEQLKLSEGKLASTTTLAEQQQQKCGDYMKAHGELKSKLEKGTAKYENLNTAFKKRTEQLENELESKKRISEQFEILKKKVEGMSRQDPDEMVLQQLNYYRTQMKCQTCQIRDKNQCLKSCGHTFCKECLEDRLKSRQRACPTCALSFGQGDVLQMYL